MPAQSPANTIEFAFAAAFGNAMFTIAGIFAPPGRSSALQRSPHLAVALGGPDHRPIDAARLVVGPRDVERQTMLVDRVGGEFRVHDFARHIECLLERAAL